MINHTKETHSYKEILPNGEIRYKIIKPCNIDNRFWLKTDPYNWILVDTVKAKPKNHYFPNIKLLSHCIVELEAKETLGNEWVCLGGIKALAL
jgi:hypothetical protein